VKADTEPSKPQIRDAGLRHIAFAVDDMEPAHGLLESAGVDFELAPILSQACAYSFFATRKVTICTS
jgi:hypothetical protein